MARRVPTTKRLSKSPTTPGPRCAISQHNPGWVRCSNEPGPTERARTLLPPPGVPPNRTGSRGIDLNPDSKTVDDASTRRRARGGLRHGSAPGIRLPSFHAWDFGVELCRCGRWPALSCLRPPRARLRFEGFRFGLVCCGVVFRAAIRRCEPRAPTRVGRRWLDPLPISHCRMRPTSGRLRASPRPSRRRVRTARRSTLRRARRASRPSACRDSERAGRVCGPPHRTG